MRILIAEDDPVLAEALSSTLRRSGYAVDWVENGRQADAALGVNEFDLLILDITLPGLCGFDVLKRLRARDSRLPVLLKASAPVPRMGVLENPACEGATDPGTRCPRSTKWCPLSGIFCIVQAGTMWLTVLVVRSSRGCSVRTMRDSVLSPTARWKSRTTA